MAGICSATSSASASAVTEITAISMILSRILPVPACRKVTPVSTTDDSANRPHAPRENDRKSRW